MIDPEDIGDIKIDVSRRLRRTRCAIGLQQFEFANEIGVGRSTYNLIETGTRQITIQVVLAIASRFGITTDWILLGDPSGLRMDMHNKIRSIADSENANKLRK